MDGLSLFSTPVVTFPEDDSAELDRELTRRMVEEADSSPGISRSNTGGWHSPPDLSLRPDACYQTLMQRVVDRVRLALLEIAGQQGLSGDLPYRFGVQAWAMVMKQGDYTVLHDHAQAHFSTAYYPDPGDAQLATYPDSGKLTFVDPRRSGAAIPGLDLYPALFSIEPRRGMLVVFPGWLQHFVHSYRGTRPRVSISCNVRLELDLGP